MPEFPVLFPPRPNTPTLDALYERNRPPGGAPRFQLIAGGWFDQALWLVQRKQGDQSAVSGAEVDAADIWLYKTLPAAVLANGGVMPAGDPNNVAFVYEPAPTVQPPAAPTPVAPVAVSPTPVVVTPIAPPAPAVAALPDSPVVQQIHEAHAESWLKKLGHVAGDVAGWCTPEHVSAVVSVLEALAPLIRKT